MRSYFVQSGPLKITLVASTAYDAALEAVRWWDDGIDPPLPRAAGDCGHRARLDAAVEVRRGRSGRCARRFATVNLLARAAGESPTQAWERILREKLAHVN